MTGLKKSSEVGIDLPAATTVADSDRISGPLVSVTTAPRASHHRKSGYRRSKTEAVHFVLRIVCLLTSVTALAFMSTAKENSSITIYGFELPLHSKWSFSNSFEYLVGVSAAVAAHSLLQLVIKSSRILRKSPIIPSRNHAWAILAVDQAFAYLLMSAGSAAAGVSNLNRTGVKHTPLPKFCNSLHSFCDRVAVSIAFTFVSCVLVAASAVFDIIWLSKY